MQINPMQRKSRNSFLLGMLVTLLVTGAVIVLLFLQLKKINEQKAEEAKQLVHIYTMAQDVKSGQILTQDMFTRQIVNRSTVPSNATSVASIIDVWFFKTKEGQQIFTDEEGLYIDEPDSIVEVFAEDGKNYIYEDGEKKVLDKSKNSDIIPDNVGAFIVDDEGKDTITRVYQEELTEHYYIYQLDSSSISTSTNKSRVKKYIEIDNVPLVAKVNMNKNTVITPELVVQSDEMITDDVRIEEYNMISLPIDLVTDDYIDIRLLTPNGQNFIVISKALVEVPKNADDTYITDTIRLKLREDEIMLMSSAIVEAYGIQGAKLYAIKYAEAGTQDAATVTYVPNREVSVLIDKNPNIIETAKRELKSRYTQDIVSIRNNYLQSLIDSQSGYNTNVQTGINESIVNTDEARRKYLQSLQ